MDIVVDTNLLLDDSVIIFKLAKMYDKIIIPITVLKELDDKKTNPDTSYSARNAINEIINFKKQFPEKIDLFVNEDGINSNDLKIIETALYKKSALATKDMSMSIIAESKNVDTKLYTAIANGISDPYTYIQTAVLESFTYAQSYYFNDYDEVVYYLSDVSGTVLDKNMWFFIFIIENNKEVALYANNPIGRHLDRIDNLPKYRMVNNNNDDGCSITAKDWYQICAIYALKEAPSVIITGKWGSGKTLLSTAYSITRNRRRTFITRPPIGINRKFDIGFLPGNKDDKLVEWCAGFLSALYFLYSNTKDQNSDGTTYDYVKDRIFKSVFEPIPINSIQGMSLLKNDRLIVDEIQLLDIDTLSMVLSRANKGSKLIMLGDLAQSYNVVRPSESGLLKLLRMLPHHSLAHVDLRQHYRDDLLEIADLLQDKSI